MPSPMPPLPPVTTATLPVRSNKFIWDLPEATTGLDIALSPGATPPQGLSCIRFPRGVGRKVISRSSSHVGRNGRGAVQFRAGRITPKRGQDMKRVILTAVLGATCMLSLAGCVVEPARPIAVAPAPVVVAPAPAFVAPAPAVVVRPRPWRRCPRGWHLGRYGHRCWRN